MTLPVISPSSPDLAELLSNPVLTKGIPLDVTRQLRIEGHNSGLVSGEVWHDIWEGGATSIPEPSSAGQQIQVVSTSASDTSAGTGAQTVRVEFLNSDDELTNEEIVMNGTTPVLSVATNVTDIIDFYSVSSGSNLAAEGDVKVTDVGNDGVIYNIIKEGGNKSMSTLRHLLPSSTFYLTSFTVSGDTRGTDIILRATCNDSGDVFDGTWLFQVPVTIDDSPAHITFDPAIVIPPTARLKVSGRGGNGTNAVSVFINGWVKV